MKSTLWAVQWMEKSVPHHLIHERCIPAIFRTRREARDFAKSRFRYFKDRPDLRAPPHSWRMPRVVRVRVVVEETSK